MRTLGNNRIQIWRIRYSKRMWLKLRKKERRAKRRRKEETARDMVTEVGAMGMVVAIVVSPNKQRETMGTATAT